jgi:hypothetical protein
MIKLPRAPDTKDFEKDSARLTKDLTPVFGKIARALLMYHSDPYELTESDIERNGTMRKKTIRLFQEIGLMQSHRLKKNEYGFFVRWYDFKDAFINHSKDYWTIYDPPAEPEEITTYLKNRETSKFSIYDGTLGDVGYTEIQHLASGDAIYVYWHLDDFDYKMAKDKLVYSVFPKKHLFEREKAILRMLVKKYSELDFKGYMEKRFGAIFDNQIEVLKKDQENGLYEPGSNEGVNFSIKIRNFMEFPETFANPDKCFFGKKGYVQEYKKTFDQVTYEYERLKALLGKVNLMGGCKQIGKDYIQECLNEIVSKAPLLINGDEGDKQALQFILDNRNRFTYDQIYK